MRKMNLGLGAAVAVLSLAAAANADPIRDDWSTYDGGAALLTDSNPLPVGGPSGGGGGGVVVLGFQGISQYNTAAFGRNFIPPDTMGAIGRTQFMETTNGAYAVYDKTTGAQLKLSSDVNFWSAAGQTGANGDSRVMFNSTYNKWVVVSFGAASGNNLSDLQIAVSDTADATGGWHSVKFTSYTGLGFGGAVADYPTLAMDGKALYIGTNNFACANSTCSTGQGFHGTSMDVIPLNSIFGGSGPTVTGKVQYNSYYNTPGQADDLSHGFALQGVNGHVGADGKVVAASLTSNQLETFNISNPTSPSGAYGAATLFGSSFGDVTPGREPGTYVSGGLTKNYTVDALDDRVSSAVWEMHGRIYSVHTVGDGLGNDMVRLTVTDAKTNAVLDETDIGKAGYDYYEGSIAVNSSGEVVVGYNRSGTSAADGVVTFLTRTYKTLANGTLQEIGGETLLTTSLTDSYHNGSTDGLPPAGRQRWGDYSQVTVDPNNSQDFWLIGEYAREFNDAQNGHPGGSGGSRWSTWIAEIDAPGVPEPATWVMMLTGLGLVGAALRRRPAPVAA